MIKRSMDDVEQEGWRRQRERKFRVLRNKIDFGFNIKKIVLPLSTSSSRDLTQSQIAMQNLGFS